MEKETKKQRGFYVEKGSFFVHAAVILLALAMAARLLGTMNLWSDAFKFATLIALPVISALLYILFILLLGRIALWSTILPVLGGAAFFILSATNGTDQLRMIICIVLSFVAAFVYNPGLSDRFPGCSGLFRSKGSDQLCGRDDASLLDRYYSRNGFWFVGHPPQKSAERDSRASENQGSRCDQARDGRRDAAGSARRSCGGGFRDLERTGREHRCLTVRGEGTRSG